MLPILHLTCVLDIWLRVGQLSICVLDILQDFRVGGLSFHSSFSTNAAICALGERGATATELRDKNHDFPEFQTC